MCLRVFVPETEFLEASTQTPRMVLNSGQITRPTSNMFQVTNS